MAANTGFANLSPFVCLKNNYACGIKQHVGNKTFQNCYFQHQELDISQTTGSCPKKSKLNKDFIQEIPDIHSGSCSSYPALNGVLRANSPIQPLKDDQLCNVFI